MMIMTSRRPAILFWKMTTRTVLTSVLGPTAVDETACRNRPCLRRYVPFGAVAWSREPGGPWSALEDLPKEWGLRPLNSGDALLVDHGEGEDGDTAARRRAGGTSKGGRLTGGSFQKEGVSQVGLTLGRCHGQAVRSPGRAVQEPGVIIAVRTRD
jgi:hypothetical protein